jgi:7-cyano-7-deazaguanine synthase in queuosine biosynthesis
MGVTPNPPELNHLDGAPKRKLIPPVKKLVYPFANMLKDKLVQIMFDEGQEDLANITHSCTERTEGRCNICWQCQERAWAFNQLNKVDTGTL